MKVGTSWFSRSRLSFLFLNLLTTVVLAEVLLRLFGFPPLQKYTVLSEPSQCLQPSAELGFQLQEGQYDITINDSLSYQATHTPWEFLSCRITRPVGAEIPKGRQIFLSGCSFPYGMGVEDSLTYPYRLQVAFPETEIINAGVPAYGTVQSLLLLRQLIAAEQVPDVFVYHYLDAHLARNILSRSFHQLLLQESRLEAQPETGVARQARFPYGRWSEDSARLQLNYASLHSDNLFYTWRTHSALLNQLEIAYNHFSLPKKQARQVTAALIRELQQLCQQHQIQFVVAILSEDPRRPFMQQLCAAENISSVDLTLDYTDPQYFNWPYDGHPNARGHASYAERMGKYLRSHP